MPDRAKLKSKPRPLVRRTGGVFAASARIVLRGILAFAAVTAALVLFGVAYTLVVQRRLNLLAIPHWFLSLSIEQWVAIGVGLAVAVIIITVPCSKLTARAGPDNGSFVPRRRMIQNLAVTAVLLLYAVGVFAAYHVSLALHHSRDWAIIHSLYSWVYVGFSFSTWIGDHWRQPPGKILQQFRAMMKI